MTKDISYEQQRLQNIKDNEALLLSLGLGVTTSKPNPKPKPKPQTPNTPTLNRKAISRIAHSRTPITGKIDADTPYTPGSTTIDSSLRRSARFRGNVDYSASGLRASSAASTPVKRKRGVKTEERGSDSDEEIEGRELQRKAQRLGVRMFDPKTFGSIPGVEVGTWWPSRMDCSTAAIHAPTVAGISGNGEIGAWSVALSGGYADDVDLGEAFTYTGSGGRDLKGTKQNPKNLRTAPQTSDQSFQNSYNAALKKSAETREPVRVIRGFKLDSPYAPPAGYRYDGLYIVEKAWMARGLTKGLKVCRYAFKRVPGQAELPVRDEE